MQDSPFSRERRQIIDNIGSFFSNLFSPDDYVEEVRKVDIALSEYGEWPWQVSLRVREAPGNDGQAVLGDRQVRSTPQVMTCTSPVLKCLNLSNLVFWHS